jgi:CBS domain-containing protein
MTRRSCPYSKYFRVERTEVRCAMLYHYLSTDIPTPSKVVIREPHPLTGYVGMVSDRGLLSWVFTHCENSSSLRQLTSNSLQHLALPSLDIHTSVVASKSSDCVLDAMKLMSEQGVSSIAVLDDDTGTLLSAVSVTDIGKVCPQSPDSVPLLKVPCSRRRLWYHLKASKFYPCR